MFKNLIIAAATAATFATGSLATAVPADAHPHGRHWPGHHWHVGPMCHKVWVKHHHHWVRVTQCHPRFWY